MCVMLTATELPNMSVYPAPPTGVAKIIHWIPASTVLFTVSGALDSNFFLYTVSGATVNPAVLSLASSWQDY